MNDFYFPIFIVLGVLPPIIIRAIEEKEYITRKIIDPYLLLLGFQILTEIFLFIIVGKGLGVVVGLIYSSLRIIQLQQLWSIKITLSKSIKIFLLVQTILWPINIVNILLTRIIPAIHG